jgi:ribonuclease E
LEGILASTVQLLSGGYIVLNQTEALVAIDVNSGRSTRERNIEETALKTNLEAAEEIARQLRLRDLAGLIVIDFIDMDESRNQHAVERKMKDVVKDDRARIQLGRISQFGLMELSRQRLRPSVAEASTQPCPHCEGTGRVRSIDSAALQVLRNIEDEGLKQRASEIVVHVPAAVGFYILNNKRDVLISAEERYAFRVKLLPDDTLIAPEHRIERLGAKTASERNAVLSAIGAKAAAVLKEEDDDDDLTLDDTENEEEENQRERRPRRRRRRSDRGQGDQRSAREQTEDTAAEREPSDGERSAPGDEESGEDEDGNKRRRRRGKRGGRRRARRGSGEDGMEVAVESASSAQDQTIEAPEEVVAEGDMSGSQEAVLSAESAPDENTEAKAPEEVEAPKKRAPRTRRPRRRAEASDPSTEAAAPAEPAAEPEAEATDGPAPSSEPTPVEQVSMVETGGEATNGTEDGPDANVAEVSQPVRSDQPARKGWWNRLLS